ncbi:MAG: hypothetical protein ABIQ08_15550, partial [Duganella sp.]
MYLLKIAIGTRIIKITTTVTEDASGQSLLVKNSSHSWRPIISGFGLSLRIALLTACSSVVLGTFAAFVLNRYQRFAGRTLFSGMVSA